MTVLEQIETVIDKTYTTFKWFIEVIFAVIVGVLIIDMLAPPPIERAADVSAAVHDKDGELLHAFSNSAQRWRFAVELDEVDPAFIDRLISIEDKRFFEHFGVDALAVMRAARSSARAGRVVSGASTITMQTARLLEPRPRTVPSKIIEMLRAFQLERRLTKTEILEMYLTLAPYGGNIEGVRAASLLYFDKEPKMLSTAEQALLIALPQAPEARRPDRRIVAARAARDQVIDKLADQQLISPTMAQEAKAERVPAARAHMPNTAYHAARAAVRAFDNALPTARNNWAHIRARSNIRASIDGGMQRELMQIVAARATTIEDGATISAMIIDNARQHVRAMIGSTGKDVPGGWIDMTSAVRSPGSTLKPFIYALAFEDGLANAETVIDDMPRAFGDYTPENFDRTFRGEVRIKEALQHSLNLPAVNVLEKIGVARFEGVLGGAGVALRRTNSAKVKDPSLAIALGGTGVRAVDLGVLYSALGNDGLVRPLSYLEGAPDTGAQDYRLMSPSTAAHINQILAEVPALEGRAPRTLSQNAPLVAYKTGTSYGYRDAWAAGHDGAYTVVVWVGRADGAARAAKTGRQTAAPILFDVFDALGLAPRDDAQRIQLASANDPDFGKTTDNPLSAFEQRARDSASLGAALNALQVDRSVPPTIVFPKNGVELFLNSETPQTYSLRARGGTQYAQGVGAQGEPYRWFVDGKEISAAKWAPPTVGFYELSVVDANGVRAASKVRVRAQ